MRNAVSWSKRILIFSVLALMLVAVLMRDEIHRLVAVNTLFEKDKIVKNFSSLDEAFDSQKISRGTGGVSELAKGEPLELAEDVTRWIADRTVTSLLILHKGQIVHESYHLDTKPEDLRIGWALSKPYISALVGVLLKDGTIGSLDDLAVQYVPSLRNTAYEGARITDLLQMTSGVAFSEKYLDYDSDINRMGRELALGGELDGFAASLTGKRSEPGEDWQYVSIDAHVLSMVLRSASGKTMADLLSDKIIRPLGLEMEPYVLSDASGTAFTMGGLNKTTRDFARFALLYQEMGQYFGNQIVPKDWVTVSTKPQAPTQPGEMGYGYHWWVPKNAEPGQFFASGIYGQYIFVDQNRDVVIVSTAADLSFEEAGVNEANIKLFQEIARSL